MFKRIIALFTLTIVAFSLAGCGGEDSTVSGLKTYDGGEYVIDINPDWKIITRSEFYADIPQEALVAFTTPEAYDGFFINVNIVREDLRQAVSPIDYARANINLAGQNLTDYTKVQEAKIQVGDHETYVHIFQARLNPTEKLIRFVQLYDTKGTFGYIVTGGMLPDTPKELRDLTGATVTSFRLK